MTEQPKPEEIPWHKPSMIPVRSRRPRILFIGDGNRTPANWYLDLLKQCDFDVYHVGSCSTDFDISNIPFQIGIHNSELGHTEVKLRTFPLKSLFDIIGKEWDLIFHIQNYYIPTEIDKCPIPYFYMVTEAGCPTVPHCVWVVLCSVDLIKRQVKSEWPSCPNIMYSPYALPVEIPAKFPEFNREFQTSFAGELYSLQIYKERSQIVHYLHEQCMKQKIPSQFHYLFPDKYTVFTEFVHNEKTNSMDIEIVKDVTLQVPIESGGCLLAVEGKRLGVMDDILSILIQQQLQKIKFKTKSTDEKFELLTKKLKELNQHSQSKLRHPEAGKGVLGPVKYKDLLQSTKIALNIPTPAGFNFRDIEACLNGAMLLTKHTIDHDLVGFEDGVNCKYFSTQEEALEIIKNGYDPEIAARGWDLVMHGRTFWKHPRGYIGNIRFEQSQDIIKITIQKYTKVFEEKPIVNALKSMNAISEFEIKDNQIILTIPTTKLTQEETTKKTETVLQTFGLQEWSVDGLTIGHRIKNLAVIFQRFAGVDIDAKKIQTLIP